MKLFDNEEPETLAESQWSVQPLWSRYLTLLVGFPAWIGFGYTIFTSGFGGLFSIVCAVAFGVVALIQAFFVARGYWRMDI